MEAVSRSFFDNQRRSEYGGNFEKSNVRSVQHWDRMEAGVDDKQEKTTNITGNMTSPMECDDSRERVNNISVLVLLCGGCTG